MSKRTTYILIALIVAFVLLSNPTTAIIGLTYPASGNYQQGVPADIRIICLLNSTACPVTTLCNLSMMAQNGTLIIDSASMERSTSFYNYSLNSNDTSQTGVNSIIIYCADDLDGNALSFQIYITPNGINLSFAYVLLYLAGIAIMGGIVLALLYGVKSSVGYVGKVAFGMLAYMFGIFLLFTIYSFTTDYFLSLVFISQLFYYLFIISLIIFVPALIVGAGALMYFTLYKNYLAKLMEQGLPEFDADRVAKRNIRRKFGGR
jgi:hypothetical protein